MPNGYVVSGGHAPELFEPVDVLRQIAQSVRTGLRHK